MPTSSYSVSDDLTGGGGRGAIDHKRGRICRPSFYPLVSTSSPNSRNGVSDDDFRSVDEQVLALGGRLDEAPDLGEAEPSIVALAYFNRGLFHLRARAGTTSRARRSTTHRKRFPFGPNARRAFLNSDLRPSRVRSRGASSCRYRRTVSSDAGRRVTVSPIHRSRRVPIASQLAARARIIHRFLRLRY